MNLTLMNKNTPVATIKAEPVIKNGFPSLEVQSCEIINNKLCPIIFLKPTETLEQTFSVWLGRRTIPRCRQDAFVPILDNPDNEFYGRDKYHFFTLNDQYWIKYSEDENWEMLNFFTNSFCNIETEDSEAFMGDIFFSDNLNSIKTFKGNFHTPDVSTEGNMLKRWYKDKNRIFLCKTGTTRQIMNEVIATSILKELRGIGLLSKEFKFVNYRLGIYNHKLCSCSNNFVTADTELVTAYEIWSAYKGNSNEANLSPAERPYAHLMNAIEYFNIPGGQAFVHEMNTADSYLNFFDRHLRNFGFLRSTKDGSFTGPAPLYDFGEIYVDDKPKDAERDMFNAQRKKLKIKLSKEQGAQLQQIINDCDLVSNGFKEQAVAQIEKKVKEQSSRERQEDL